MVSMTTMADRDGVIWMDGAMVPWREAKTHVLTHTLHYGLGVFEGVRAYQTIRHGTCIFRLKEHTDRLFNSAHILGMTIPFSKKELVAAQKAVVVDNHLAEAYLRPMCFYGAEGMGLHADHLQTHVIIAAWPWPSYLSPDAQGKGIKVKTASYTRHHVNIAMCKAKATGHYINSMLALKEALDCGCDEALLLDTEGFVSEGSGQNIFIVVDNEIHTPELASCLDGITRATIIELADELGYTIKERRMTRDEVYIADEAFFTGTAAEVLPIAELDGRMIGNGQRGVVTEQLQTLYFDTVRGRHDAHLDWLEACTK